MTDGSMTRRSFLSSSACACLACTLMRTMDASAASSRLTDSSADLNLILTRGNLPPPKFDASAIKRESVWVTMRDGIRLRTDLYLPPVPKAPTIAMRTPYARARYEKTFITFAQHGYAVASQDCRGTGDSEPDHWDFGMYENEDCLDCVDWVVKQKWFDGFLTSCGGSYVAGMQWAMARHPRMSTIAPEVGGLISSWQTARFFTFVNSYSRTVGKGADKVATAPGDVEQKLAEAERRMEKETLAGGYFNEPMGKPFSAALLDKYPKLRELSSAEGKRWLWGQYESLPPQQRAELIKLAMGEENVTFSSQEAMTSIFGNHISHGGPSIYSPGVAKEAKVVQAPALIITGWYDWDFGGALASWDLLLREAHPDVASRSRLLICPSAHNKSGYSEGKETHPELKRIFRTPHFPDLLLRWYETVREKKTDSWPRVIYYMTGANEWRVTEKWPPPEVKQVALHLGPDRVLAPRAPTKDSEPDRYTYDPRNPTPTIGGSVVSYVYTPGSVDVSAVQKRPDVVTYSTAPLEHDLDVVGPLRLVMYASSSALDTDFNARLSDVFPDGRALQLQSNLLRVRYRDPRGEPELLEPGRVYRFEIDLWATANRFKAGHRLRLDISSADFPKYDRNTNLGGKSGDPVPAKQAIYHDVKHPSHLLISVMGSASIPG